MLRIVAAVIREGDQYLLGMRAAGQYAGCWEFPGGKVEPGESDPEALIREIKEELGIYVCVGYLIWTQTVTDGRVFFYEARQFDGELKTDPTVHSRLAWVSAFDFPSMIMAPYDNDLADVLYNRQVKEELDEH